MRRESNKYGVGSPWWEGSQSIYHLEWAFWIQGRRVQLDIRVKVVHTAQLIYHKQINIT